MSEDSEPEERATARPLFVPVRTGPAGSVALMYRTPLGARTAVGFTSAQRLAATLGPAHDSVRLSHRALRALAEPLGITHIAVDPRLAAPAPPAPSVVSPVPHAGSGRPRGEFVS
ncbi:SAV_915 family protein [Streptomyces iconiensis]|uniref:SseB protein N-terminal domain-containing protein n=1 Tax=Streptomyces iconiensis TaxID=1384038 RepID=A0ABT7A4P8_9ACTN|nr:SAV_915 family protein [Streptomyces iconiensis]MDJ1136323.1 hypothetical protein [Streptomyces iconiensis]